MKTIINKILGSQKIIFLIVFWGICLALFLDLDHFPPLWWDEGWTLLVARNWVEYGFYGRFLNGEPYTAGLAGHFPVVASVALSFKLFGVGAWQGRLPCALLTLGACGLLFFLAQRLYNRVIAYGALFLLILAQPGEPLRPLFMGRQVLGEMPALFYLLAGYACLWGALRRSRWWILPALIFWGIAIRTKAQVPYFWMASLLVPLIIVISKRWWNEASLLAVGLVGTYLISNYGLAHLQSMLIAGRFASGSSLQGAMDVLVFVSDPSVRWNALHIVLALCWPALIGIGWICMKSFRTIMQDDLDRSNEIVRLSLLVFSGGWFAWYIMMGMYWGRYVMPANFIGSIFGAALLSDLTHGFDFRWTARQAFEILIPKPHNKLGLRNILIRVGYFALACWLIASTVLTMYYHYIPYIPLRSRSAEQVAGYINAISEETALIESYESEVLFFLNCRYHFPPDQVSMELVRREHLDPTLSIDYDPLEADPDYLVLGSYDYGQNLYRPWLRSGDFQLVKEFEIYRIYERVRR